MRNALFFLACFSILFCFNGANAEEQNVKIGFLSPQTGPIADYAEGFEMGGEIAIDDLNAKYEGEYNFELVIADSACDGDQSDDAAQELVNEGVIGIAGAACSGATLGAMPVAKDAQIPLVSYASTSPALSDADDDGYLWRVVPADTFFSTGVADLVDSQNVHGYNSAIIYIQGDYFEDSAMAFKDSWEERQYEVCNLQGIQVGQDDFSEEVDNIESDGCDNVVIFSYLEEMVGIIEEIRDQNMDIGIFGGAFVDPEDFVNSFEDVDDVDGVYTVDWPRWDVHNPAVRKHYDDECNNRSSSCDDYIYHYEAYDAVNIIAEAFVLGGGNRNDVNSFIDDIGDTYIGATYTMFFDENGDVGGVGFNFCKHYIGPNGEANYDCDGVWNPRFGILDEKVDISLGFLNPFTGPIAIYAEGFTVSWDVAIDHLNEIYGFLNFEVIEGDSACDGTTAATAAQTLVDDGVYAIAGAACSGATLGAMEITSENQIPQVAYPSTSPAITDADDDGYLFRVVPSDAQQGQAIADLVAYYDFENPALLYMTNDYGAGTADAIENRLNEKGIETCVEIGYDDDQTDFYYEVEEIKDNGCDSVIMVAYATDGAAIIEELRDQDVSISIFGSDVIADQAFLNEFSDPMDAEGVFATKPHCLLGWEYQCVTTTEGPYFDADYNVKCEEEYDGGDCEDGIYTREAYDSVMILGRAIYAAGYSGLGSGGDEGETIRDMLPYVGRSYQGASGLIDFDENGDISGSGYDICRFEYDADDLEFVCRGTWTLSKGLKGVDFEVIIQYEPTSSILYYDAAPFVTGYSYFLGEGHAYGGEEIVAYEWYSDIDSVFGDSLDTETYLSAGAHNISFRVQDSVGNWSEPDSIMVFVYEMPKLIIDETVDHAYGGSSLHDMSIHWHPEFEERYDDDYTQWWEGEFEVFACVRLNNVSFDENLDWDSGCENGYGWEYLYIWDEKEFETNYTWDPYDYGHYDVSVAFYFWYVFDVYVSEPDHFGYTVRDFYPEIVFEEDPEETIFGEPVTFSAYGIHGDCGEYCAEISGYQWISDLDGQLSENGTFTTDGLSMGMHQITFIVEMYKEGVYSSTVEESFSVWVYANPVAHAGEDVIVQPGDNVQFAGAGTDEDGEVVKYEWDLNGDGIFEFKSDDSGITTFIYNDEGEFVTTLRVTDNDGHTNTDERLITVVSEEEEEIIQEEKIVPGCIYQDAKNYNPDATEDDGSCDFSADSEPLSEDSGSLPSVSFVMALTALSLIALRRKH